MSNSLGSRLRHGMAGTQVHNTWTNIRQRCHNPKVPHYPRYGGRGITVCDRWRQSFELFFEDMGIPPEGTEIERKDNLVGYTPDNCIWATRSVNCRNRRSTRWINVDGKQLSMAEASEVTGISYNTMKCRLKNNLDPITGERSKANE